MASSRSSPPAEAAREIVTAAVRSAAAQLLDARGRPSGTGPFDLVVALSGGRDSMVLLDACASLPAVLPVGVRAVHVHHGLSTNADAWADFCTAECGRRGIPLQVRRVQVLRRSERGVEAAARSARYAALVASGGDAILFAHHADDQAETVLLQLLRGAGVHGLAAMPVLRAAVRATPGRCDDLHTDHHTDLRTDRDSPARPAGQALPQLLRPLLALDRRTLERYAHERSVAWIDDESNDDRRLRRNFLRHEVTPRLAEVFPGYPQTLVRTAGHLGEAAELLDALARIDAGLGDADGQLPDARAAQPGERPAAAAPALERTRLSDLAQRAPERARNLLRWFLREHGLAPASTARLAAMLEQLTDAAPDARVRLVHDRREIGIHRGSIVVHAPAPAAFALAWNGERRVVLPHGELEFAPVVGDGLAVAALAKAPVTVRSRSGGEVLALAPDGRPRRLKHLLQTAGVAAWDRAALPLVFCGETLVGVPGIGIDARCRAGTGEPGRTLVWHPHAGYADEGPMPRT